MKVLLPLSIVTLQIGAPYHVIQRRSTALVNPNHVAAIVPLQGIVYNSDSPDPAKRLEVAVSVIHLAGTPVTLYSLGTPDEVAVELALLIAP